MDLGILCWEIFYIITQQLGYLTKLHFKSSSALKDQLFECWYELELEININALKWEVERLHKITKG